MNHLWKSLRQKRTIAIRYEPSAQLLSYLSDMRDATRMALAHALVDAKLNDGKIPSPIRLRKKTRPWFVSSMPYARHHINPVCSKAVALLRAYRKRHKRLGLPSLEKLSMRIDGELFKMTRDEDDGQVTIRVTIRPHEYEHIKFRPNHKKWDAYSKGRLGEITLTDSRLLLTFVKGLATKPLGDQLVGVDLNFATVDCTPIDGGHQKMMIRHPVTIPTGNIEHIQDSFSRRRRRLQLHVRNPEKRARKLEETRGRQRCRVRDALQKLTHGPGEEVSQRHIRLRGPQAHQEHTAEERTKVQGAPEPMAIPDGADDGRLQVADGDSVPNSERDLFEVSRMRWKDRAPNSDPVRHTLEGQRLSNMRRELRQESTGQSGHSLPWRTPLRTTVLRE